jgi:hypothetical protein
MGLEDAFSEADADPGKRKVAEVEGGPLAWRSLRSTIKAHGVGSKTVQRIRQSWHHLCNLSSVIGRSRTRLPVA